MKKLFKKRAISVEAPSSLRITNETVAEHREKILAGGRRFKYPVQYAKHKLVFNAVLIALTTLLIIGVIGWWQLYSAQNTSNFFYRATRIIPLPVASIDGETVRYSDYLMRYRSQVHWLDEKGQIEQGEQDNQRQANYIKRSVLDNIEANAYASKLAREMNITVDEDEVDDVIDRSLQTANGTISQDLYDASTLDTLGYSRDEYRLIINQSLLKQKVAYEMDSEAKTTLSTTQKLLATNSADFDATATTIGNNVQSGASGLVRKNNQDGGLTQAASKLSVGQTSGVIKSTTGDGYYLVKLLEITDTQLSYGYIKIPLISFAKSLAKIRADGKVKEYISIPKSETTPVK